MKHSFVLGVLLLVPPANHSGSHRATLHYVCSVYWGVFSTSGGYHEYIGGYHEYIERCSVHWRVTMMNVNVQHIEVFNISQKAFINLLSFMNYDASLMYSWYPSDVLNTPQCTHDIPSHESRYPSDVLNTLKEHPPM